MFRNRIIPCLLIKNGKLVKTIKFKNPAYIGDPINAIKIYSEKEVDELILLDISASLENREPRYDILERMGEECYMPLSYGGGVRNIETAKKIIQHGFEKVIINSYVSENPNFITELSEHIGSQSVVVAVDVKKNLFGKYKVYSHSGTKELKVDLIEYCKHIQNIGAGEIFLNSIDKDGTWEGYDLKLIKQICDNTSIPVNVCGGAGKISDFINAVKCGANGCSAGSMAVYQGKDLGVLINFPTREKIRGAFDEMRKMCV